MQNVLLLPPENNTERIYKEKVMKTLKVKRRWIILMTAMTLIAVAGLAHIGERELAEYEEHIREKEKK